MEILSSHCGPGDLAMLTQADVLVLYWSAMASKVAREHRLRQASRLAALTPADRIALVERLGRDGLASFMTTHGIDRTTAIRRIKTTRRLGRRPSASADEP
jgi:hypothetical protein